MRFRAIESLSHKIDIRDWFYCLTLFMWCFFFSKMKRFVYTFSYIFNGGTGEAFRQCDGNHYNAYLWLLIKFPSSIKYVQTDWIFHFLCAVCACRGKWKRLVWRAVSFNETLQTLNPKEYFETGFNVIQNSLIRVHFRSDRIRSKQHSNGFLAIVSWL